MGIILSGFERLGMYVDCLVRITIGTLAILGFKLSALYFLLMVLLLNTHHKEFFGW
ncbi:hypothetical protein [Vibrio sp. 99-70-13A1]|uniref:hypothetical protein n=1 Tax=Vibrio sp. 99-70-13A1 TaxID=2607601 RepID=UPI00149333F7|nr:hypothetical protein [Vibrio sp. 99-70-13A1]